MYIVATPANGPPRLSEANRHVLIGCRWVVLRAWEDLNNYYAATRTPTSTISLPTSPQYYPPTPDEYMTVGLRQAPRAIFLYAPNTAAVRRLLDTPPIVASRLGPALADGRSRVPRGSFDHAEMMLRCGCLQLTTTRNWHTPSRRV